MSALVPGIGPVLAVGLAGAALLGTIGAETGGAIEKSLSDGFCPPTNYLFTRTLFARAAPCSLPWQTVPSKRKQLEVRSKMPARKASIERDICGGLAFEMSRRKNTNEPAVILRMTRAISAAALKLPCTRTTVTNPTKPVAISCAIGTRTTTRVTLFGAATNAEAPTWQP